MLEINRRNLTEGNIFFNLLYLAVPAVVTTLFHTLYNLIDTFWVGKIDAVSVAAVSLAFTVIFILISILSGISIGISAVVAKHYGAKKIDYVKRIIGQTVVIGIITVFLCYIFTILLLRHVLSLLGRGITSQLFALTYNYLIIIFSGSFGIIFTFFMNGIMRGIGDTKTPMFILMFSTALNIILDPVLIFGIPPFPRLNIYGAAIATVVSRITAAFLSFFYVVSILRPKHIIDLPDIKIIKEIFSISIPTILTQLSTAIGVATIMSMVIRYGPQAVAAFGIAFRVEAIAILPIIGINIAIISLIGQNLGAEKYERLFKTVKSALYITIAFLSVVSLAIILFSNRITGIFNENPEVMKIGAQYFRLIPVSYIAVGICLNIVAVYQGLGLATTGLFLALFRYWIMIIPLSYLFSFILKSGIAGIWYGIVAGHWLGAVISVVFIFNRIVIGSSFPERDIKYPDIIVIE